MFDFFLPNSTSVLPVEHIQIPDSGVAFPELGQSPGGNTPPAKLIIEPPIDQPSIGQLPDHGAPPPIKIVFGPSFLPEAMPTLGQSTGDNAPPPRPK